MKFNTNFIFILLLSMVNAYAQPTDELNRYRRYDSSLATLQLDTLNGKTKILYSKNYEVRAKTIQSLVDRASVFYENKFPEVTFTVQVLILNKEDFNKVLFPLGGKGPYGMPFNISKRNSIVIGADKKAMGDNSPDSVLSDWDDTVVHELGHIFWNVEKNVHPKEKWANEFIANYFDGYHYFETHPNEVVNLSVPENKPGAYQPQYRTLEDFERLYINVGARNYGWSQKKFGQLSDRLYAKFKIELISKIADNYGAHGKNLDFLTFLRQLDPAITNQWLIEMK